jgi:hypothetical protein
MIGKTGKTHHSVLSQLSILEQALADVRLERKIALANSGPCADLVANKAAWDRDEKNLLQRISSLRADLV